MEIAYFFPDLDTARAVRNSRYARTRPTCSGSRRPTAGVLRGARREALSREQLLRGFISAAWTIRRDERRVEGVPGRSSNCSAGGAAPVPELEQRSADGTRKWLLDVARARRSRRCSFRSRRAARSASPRRLGCALECSFCSTGRQGFNRNLIRGGDHRSAVACEPLALARRRNRASVTNVVMMGMGEPLANYRNVVPAMQLMLDDCAYGLSRRRVTCQHVGSRAGRSIGFGGECPSRLPCRCMRRTTNFGTSSYRSTASSRSGSS